MMRISSGITVLLALLTWCCAEPGAKQNRIDALGEVRQTLLSYQHDINENGLLAEFKYLDSSEHFYWVPPGFTQPLNYDTIAHILKQNAGKYKCIQNSYDTLLLHSVSEDTVKYTACLRSVMVDIESDSSTYLIQEKGIMIRRTGGWRLLSGRSKILSHWP